MLAWRTEQLAKNLPLVLPLGDPFEGDKGTRQLRGYMGMYTERARERQRERERERALGLGLCLDFRELSNCHAKPRFCFKENLAPPTLKDPEVRLHVMYP